MSVDSPPEISPLPAWRQRRQSEPARVAVIGAGPVGLEAALYAQQLGLKAWLFEREAQAAADVRAWAHVTMFTPWSEIRSPLGERALAAAATKPVDRPAPALYPTGGEFVDHYLDPLARLLGDSLLRETRVVGVGRSYIFPEDFSDAPERREARRFRLLTRSPLEERVFTADYVLDASGVSHTPNWAGVGGLPALGEMGSAHQIFYGIPDITGRDRVRFLGKRTLLIGDGTSAATSALLLAEVTRLDPPGQVIWVAKAPGELPLSLVPNDPLPRRDVLLKKANLLAAQPPEGWEYLPRTQVEAIQHSLGTGRFQVTLQVDRVTRRIAVDAVIANVGSKTGVHTFERTLQPEESGFFTLGAKAAGIEDAAVLLPSARAQIRAAFRQIMADPALDLYADAERAHEA